MIKKIIHIILLFVTTTLLFAQAGSEQSYNNVTSRSFLKFSRFLTVPTFSTLREDNSSVALVVRNSFVEFEDSPTVYIASFSGKVRDNIGVGVAVFQKNVGVFKDFGVVANYANTIQIGNESDLTLGFNFMYSRRSANEKKVISDAPDPLLTNFQDIPIVNLQPAITYSYKNFDVGLFMENLLDFDMKESKMATEFAKKTFSAHAMYSHSFDNTVGLFQSTELRFLAIARKMPEEFGYAGNFILDLPKAGWLKATYDNIYGIGIGAGINISDKLSLGYTYEKKEINTTNEFGVLYKFGGKRRRVKSKRRVVIVKEPETIVKEKIVYKDSEKTLAELQKAKDSIDALNKKLKNTLQDNSNTQNKQKEDDSSELTPDVDVEEEPVLQVRNNYKPWRKKPVVASSTGVSYFVVADQFKDKQNAQLFAQKLKDKGADVQYFRHPQTGSYCVYFQKFGSKKEADDMVADVNEQNTTPKLVTKDVSSGDVISKVKNAFKEPVYVVKATFGEVETPSNAKPKKPRFSVIPHSGNLQRGYYLVVNVFSKKSYADRNIEELNNDNIPAGFFINPKNGYRYVYIAKANSRAELTKLYYNDLNGSYYLGKSIYQIK